MQCRIIFPALPRTEAAGKKTMGGIFSQSAEYAVFLRKFPLTFSGIYDIMSKNENNVPVCPSEGRRRERAPEETAGYIRGGKDKVRQNETNIVKAKR